jgi:tRNA pseudouridine55 synthase
MDGLLVVDKPAGPTSHDVVARMRRVLGEPRIGHTGTLDPSASGVLPLVLGRATRLARFMSGAGKSYQAIVRFGFATDTYDSEGLPLDEPPAGGAPSRDRIEAALDAFRGTFDQQPPAFSAKKIAGRRSYETARASRFDPARPAGTALPTPVPVTVQRLEIVDFAGDCVTLTLDCSAGFYVRALAHDLGARLGVGAHLAGLRRTASAGLTLADATPLDIAERTRDETIAAILPLERMLPGLAALVLSAAGVERVVHGRDIRTSDISQGRWIGIEPVRLFNQAGQLIAIGEATAVTGLLHPCVVLR